MGQERHAILRTEVVAFFIPASRFYIIVRREPFVSRRVSLGEIAVRTALLILVTVLLAFGFGCASEPRLSLGPETVVVVPSGGPDAETREAANLLQEWLRKATANSAGFEIVSENALALPLAETVIALGDTQWMERTSLDGLGRDGYRVRRVGRVIAIGGETSRGTFHGAVAFLDRLCGVRFYLPGDLFVSLPPNRRVTVGDVDFTGRPFAVSCVLSGIAEQSPVQAKWVKRVGGLRPLGGTCGPNIRALFSSNAYTQRFPEICPLLDGERRFPAGAEVSDWQPCLTAPTLVDAAVEAAAAHFRAQPQDAYLSFAIENSGRFCECDDCEAIAAAYAADDPRNGRRRARSVLYWRFLNAVAGRLERVAPGKRIVALGYGEIGTPPPFDLHPNIVVFTRHHVAATERNGTASEEEISPERWLDLGAGFGNADEYLGGGYLVPRPYGDRWARFLRRVKARRDEAYLELDCTPNWALDGPKVYVLSRLCWDPDKDPGDLQDRFCKDMFGAAARPMAAYFRTLEALWERLEKENPERVPYLWGTQFDATPRSMALVREARLKLDEAVERARTSPAEQRVGFFSRGFRLTEYLIRIAATDEPSPALLGQTESWMRALLATDPLALDRPAIEDALDTMFPRR